MTKINSILKILINNLEEGLLFEHIIVRNHLSNFSNLNENFKLIENKLAKNGDISIIQTIASKGSRLSEFIINPEAKILISKAEDSIYKHNKKGICGWNQNDLFDYLEKNDYEYEKTTLNQNEMRYVSPDDIERWVRKTYAPTLKKLKINFDEKDLIETIRTELGNKNINWYHYIVIIRASNTIKKKKEKNNIGKKEWEEIHKKTK